MVGRIESLDSEILREVVYLQKEVSQSGIELQTVMQTIVDGIQRIMKFDGAIIEIAEGDSLIYKAISGETIPQQMLGLKVKKNESLSGLSIKLKEVQRCDDSETDPRVDRVACRKINLRSMIVVPFETKSGIAGVLKVISKKINAFKNEHELITAFLAESLANSLYNAEIAQELAKKNKSIQKQRNYLHAILENLSDGVMATNEHNEIVIFNKVLREWCQIKNQSELPVRWSKYMQLKWPYDSKVTTGESLVEKVMSGESINRIELKLLNSVPEKTLIISGEKILNEKNGLQGCIIVFHDVTEQHKAHQEITKLNQSLESKVEERTTQLKTTMIELQRAFKARDEFLSIASHELKTPLTSLKLLTQMRQRDIGKTSEVSPILDNVKGQLKMEKDQIDRISRLVEDMLDIARIGADKLSLKKRPTKVTDLLLDLIQRYNGPEESNQIKLKINLDEELTANWDRFRIEQVVCNLLSNALKYGLGRPIEIFAHQELDLVIIEVTDQGLGISLEDQKRIFERFERAIDKSEISGLGLGLFIAQEIVKKHGGLLEVRSELGKGSTFTIKLPL